MAEVVAQRVRRVLITTVSGYDSTVVNQKAIINSEEFISFLNKPLLSGGLNSHDVIEISNNLEDSLGISLPDPEFVTWRDYFDHLVKELNRG